MYIAYIIQCVVILSLDPSITPIGTYDPGPYLKNGMYLEILNEDEWDDACFDLQDYTNKVAVTEMGNHDDLNCEGL